MRPFLHRAAGPYDPKSAGLLASWLLRLDNYRHVTLSNLSEERQLCTLACKEGGKEEVAMDITQEHINTLELD